MYTDILIPTDGSEVAGKAVKHGVALAKRIGAKVTVLTVLQPFHPFTTDAQMLEDTAAWLRNLWARSLPRRKPQVLCARRSRVEHEHPYQAIIDIAGLKGCDLIVTASHAVTASLRLCSAARQ
jgi:nucleotide-binding universal stress UspA family protein